MAEVGGDGSSDLYHSIPRGGPLYLSNLVGSLTNPPSFRNHLLSQPQDLREELGQDFNDTGEEDDLSVDELKIVTEEELVDKAFDIAFKDEVTKTVPEVSEKCLDERTEIGKISETRDNAIAESSKSGTDGACLDEIGISDSSERLCNNSKKRQGRKIKRQSSDRRKRKRDDNQTIDMKRRKRPKKLTVEESYTAKVKELVGIKEEQLEDKAAAKLHSFNGRINDSTMTSSERLDRTTSLKSNNSTAKLPCTYDTSSVKGSISDLAV